MASACRVVASAVLFGLLACGAYSKEDGLSELGILNNFDVKPGGQEHEYEASVVSGVQENRTRSESNRLIFCDAKVENRGEI